MKSEPLKPEVVGGGGKGFDPSQLKGMPQIVVGLVLVIAIAFWVIRGGPTYTVATGEEGLVLTFGKFSHIAENGLHFKLPWPIQTVEKVNISEVNRIEIGFRSQPPKQNNIPEYITFDRDKSLLGEAQMLTGDENVVDCSMAIQYRIKDSKAFLFNFRPGDVKKMLQAVAEAALRQAVGDHPINDVLTTGKFEIMSEIKQKMQDLADLTGAGVNIEAVLLQDVQPPAEVAAAFKDVSSAREEKEKIINEARAYQSGEIPRAEGEAGRIKLESEGYKQSRIAEAQGSVARFQSIATQYKSSPEITRARLYLDAMEILLPKAKLTLVDGSTGVVNLKNLAGPTFVPQAKSANVTDQGASK